MQESQSAVFARPDTMFGVCEALGQDFGFNPLWLRIALGVALLWNPVAVVGAYAVAAVLVVISRLAVPGKRKAVRTNIVEAPVALKADNNTDEEILAVAA